MAVSKQKMILLLVREIIGTETDRANPLTRKEICDKIEQEFPYIKVGQRDFDTDIDTLTYMGTRQGFDIKVKKLKDNALGYYAVNRPFSLSHLQILVDMVLSSRFVTEELSKDMVGRLAKQTSTHNAKFLKRLVFVRGRIKCMNEGIFKNSNIIQEAIRRNRKISFCYCDWNSDKKLERKYHGRKTRLIPTITGRHLKRLFLSAFPNIATIIFVGWKISVCRPQIILVNADSEVSNPI